MIILRDKTFSSDEPKKKKKIGKKARNTGILATGTGLGIYGLGKFGDKIAKGKSPRAGKIAELAKKNKYLGLGIAGGGAALGIAGEIKRRKEKKDDNNTEKE